MIIKSFVEQSSSAALKRVREEMGGEAIVLKTRQVKGTGNRPAVEVTACLESPTVAQSSRLLASPVGTLVESTVELDSTFEDSDSEDTAIPTRKIRPVNRLAALDRSPIEDKIDEERRRFFDQVEDQLRKADFPMTFIQRLVQKVNQNAKVGDDLSTLTRKTLVDEVAALMAPAVTIAPGDRVLFVGPAGAGKSTAVAKLAAQLILLQKQRVSLVTLDSVKMAAFDEIAGYGRILGADVVDLQSEENDPYLDPQSITLIDSPALPNDPVRLERLARQVASLSPTHVMAVYSALTRSGDIPRLANNAAVLEPTHIVMTMLDLTDLGGTAVAAAEASGCRIGFVTDSPSGTGQIKTPDPDRMIRNLLQAEATLD